MASLSWKPISGAVRYAVLVDDSIIADNITDVSYECEVSANEEHNIDVYKRQVQQAVEERRVQDGL